VGSARQRLPHRAPRARSTPTPTGNATSATILDTTGLALPAMWSTDGHRPDPLQAPAHHRHTRLRHLMNVQQRHSDRRRRQRGRSRVTNSVPRCVVAACHIGRRTVRSMDGERAAAARAPTAPRPTTPHPWGSRFQLHSRPPRQWLPSSLVIETASASTSSQHSALCAEALPINARATYR
jgi:hypothetical protein